MCGIAGAFQIFGDATNNLEVVRRINEHQRRRGPDGDGIWYSPNHVIALGHRRLAIIDTGPAGAQPMHDATGRWTVTFNGEIYNYQELRLELEGRGRKFSTHSDTEVLVNAIAEWGEAGLVKLRGMFAFALWDSAQHELWLARDPYGVKPLYTAQSNGVFWFASQARALAECAPVDLKRNAAALVGFYLWGSVPEPFSWWSGIQLLPAGHVQRVRNGYASAPRPYRRIQDAYTQRPWPLQRGDLREIMLDSVKKHLIADVEVGVFLSAGIDSSVIAALAAEFNSKLRTVTLAFDEYAGKEDDEAPIAEQTASLINSDHVTVRISGEEFLQKLDSFFEAMDQPTIDGLNTYLLSQAAAKLGLKVALSGLGGDELFGGYPSFKQIPKLLKWWRPVMSTLVLKESLAKLLRDLAPAGFSPKLAGLFTHTDNVASAYLLRRALYLEGELDALLDESWLKEGFEQLQTAKRLSEIVSDIQQAGCSVHTQIAAMESCWYMRNQLLRDTDWASMAHGLEVRVPFVDASVLNAIARSISDTVPPTKLDLMGCVRANLKNVTGRRKTGFTTPVSAWIGNGSGTRHRGLRGWANRVHREFRTEQKMHYPNRAVKMVA